MGIVGPAASHLRPPEGQEGQEEQGHEAWIGELQPLNRHKVAFSGFVLRLTDLLCIVRTLDQIRVGAGCWESRGQACGEEAAIEAAGVVGRRWRQCLIPVILLGC